MEFLSRNETVFLLGAITTYLGAMLLLWSHLFFVREEDESAAPPRSRLSSPLWLGHALLAIGALIHLAALIGQGSQLLMVRAGVVGCFGWALVVAYLGLGRRLGRASLGAFVTPVALAAALFSLSAPPLHHVPRPEQVQTPYWLMHVVIIVIGYVALAFAFAASLVYLLQETLLKRKQLSGLWQRLPSLQVADEWIYRATSFGLAMLTVGIFTGLAWTLQHPTAMSPLLDPKVALSLATWLTFALYLAARWWLGWRGRRTNLVVVWGFVLLAISFFGTPHFLSGQ